MASSAVEAQLESLFRRATAALEQAAPGSQTPDHRLVRLLKCVNFQLERHIIVLKTALDRRRDVLFEVDSHLTELVEGTDALDDRTRQRTSALATKVRTIHDELDTLRSGGNEFMSSSSAAESTRLRTEKLFFPQFRDEPVLAQRAASQLTVWDVCSGSLDHLHPSYVARVSEGLSQLLALSVSLSEVLRQQNQPSALRNDDLARRLELVQDKCDALAEDLAVWTTLVGPSVPDHGLHVTGIGSGSQAPPSPALALPELAEVMSKLPRFTTTESKTKASSTIKSVLSIASAREKLLNLRFQAVETELQHWKQVAELGPPASAASVGRSGKSRGAVAGPVDPHSVVMDRESLNELICAFHHFDGQPSEVNLRQFLAQCKQSVPLLEMALARVAHDESHQGQLHERSFAELSHREIQREIERLTTAFEQRRDQLLAETYPVEEQLHKVRMMFQEGASSGPIGAATGSTTPAGAKKRIPGGGSTATATSASSRSTATSASSRSTPGYSSSTSRRP